MNRLGLILLILVVIAGLGWFVIEPPIVTASGNPEIQEVQGEELLWVYPEQGLREIAQPYLDAWGPHQRVMMIVDIYNPPTVGFAWLDERAQPLYYVIFQKDENGNWAVVEASREIVPLPKDTS